MNGGNDMTTKCRDCATVTEPPLLSGECSGADKPPSYLPSEAFCCAQAALSGPGAAGPTAAIFKPNYVPPCILSLRAGAERRFGCEVQFGSSFRD